MRIAIRKPKPKAAVPSFTDLANEACAVERERRKYAELAKLTRGAFLREAIYIAGTTEKRLGELREKVCAPASAYVESKAFLQRASIAVRSPNWPGPPRELRRFNSMLTPGALGEFVALGTNTFKAFALAVLIATKEHPEAFGNCEDLAAHEQQLLELTVRRDKLYAEMEHGHTPDDLLIGTADADGRAPVTFKITNGEVQFGPNVGERVVNWLLEH